MVWESTKARRPPDGISSDNFFFFIKAYSNHEMESATSAHDVKDEITVSLWLRHALLILHGTRLNDECS